MKLTVRLNAANDSTIYSLASSHFRQVFKKLYFRRSSSNTTEETK